MEFFAQGKYLLVSPKKVWKLSRFLKGRSYQKAMGELRELNSKAARYLENLIKSAFYNGKAKNPNLEEKNVSISYIHVSIGSRHKRMNPRAQGRAYLVRKLTSHVRVVLNGERGES